MLRHWLITSTTYGTWLPGDTRGSVTSVRDYRREDLERRVRVEHDRYGEAWEPPIAGLQRSATAQLKGAPIYLSREQAAVVLDSFVASADYRGWLLHAVSVMPNHFHLVVSAVEEVRSETLMRDFKSYASRDLNRRFGRRRAGTWWTASGSRRPLRGERALESAIGYVLEGQPNPLCTWSAPQDAPRSRA